MDITFQAFSPMLEDKMFSHTTCILLLSCPFILASTMFHTTLRNNKDTVIKPTDKGGNIVIMNKQDYLQEGLKQLSNRNHYEILEEDPTQEYNNQIY